MFVAFSALLSPLFLIATASSPCLFLAAFRFPLAGSGADVSASLSGPVSKELQLADVLALGEGLDSVPLEMSLWIAVSETNLGFTLSLNPRKESMTSKNSNFSRPLPVALLLSLMLLYLSKRVPFFFQLAQGLSGRNVVIFACFCKFSVDRLPDFLLCLGVLCFTQSISVILIRKNEGFCLAT